MSQAAKKKKMEFRKGEIQETYYANNRNSRKRKRNRWRQSNNLRVQLKIPLVNKIFSLHVEVLGEINKKDTHT